MSHCQYTPHRMSGVQDPDGDARHCSTGSSGLQMLQMKPAIREWVSGLNADPREALPIRCRVDPSVGNWFEHARF